VQTIARDRAAKLGLLDVLLTRDDGDVLDHSVWPRAKI
jgi:hypothetical protein